MEFILRIGNYLYFIYLDLIGFILLERRVFRVCRNLTLYTRCLLWVIMRRHTKPHTSYDNDNLCYFAFLWRRRDKEKTNTCVTYFVFFFFSFFIFLLLLIFFFAFVRNFEKKKTTTKVIVMSGGKDDT